MGCSSYGKFFLLLVPITATLFGCQKESPPVSQGLSAFCAPTRLGTAIGSRQGNAYSFLPDPMVSSMNPNLSPSSKDLDQYRSLVTLSNLGGKGVLEGSYVDVRDRVNCNEWFGAYDVSNNFSYSRQDPRFQSAMAYFFGDQYRQSLDSMGYLIPVAPVRIVAHCMVNDNAYYSKAFDEAKQVISRVCLGDSRVTPGASYGDDGVVTIHELQHATTGEAYSVNEYLNQFWYDEGGALNEAVSDFMSLVFTAQYVSGSVPPLDLRLFSRWALGTFFGGIEATRGAHRCPAYDSDYPRCQGFDSPTQFGTSVSGSTISYIYPDGLSWPYARKSFDGPTYDARNAFLKYPAQEEIHNAGVLLEGGLWDVYEALKTSHGGDGEIARALSMKLVLEGIRHLPQPSLNNRSPVTFRGLASNMVDAADALSYSAQDQAAVSAALTARGLYGGNLLASDWATPAPGAQPTMKILDDPNQLEIWLFRMGSDPSQITHGISTGTNAKLDPGEVVAVWFDIPNQSDYTAGGVLLSIVIPDEDADKISFLDFKTNGGYISPKKTQIRYSKINGKAIVNSLNVSNPNHGVPTGNSYFKTNPYYSFSFTTAVWVKVNPSAQSGTPVKFQVEALPSNGAASNIEFRTTVN